VTDSDSVSKPETSGPSNSNEPKPFNSAGDDLEFGLPDDHPLKAAPEPEDTRPQMNRAARRQAARGEMNQPLQNQDQERAVQAGAEIGKGIASLFKGKEKPYTSILKSLDQIGLTPKIMDVLIGEEPVSCFVIPVQELVFKEWQLMSGGQYTSTAPGEGT
jgi:hypothetical protein